MIGRSLSGTPLRLGGSRSSRRQMVAFLFTQRHPIFLEGGNMQRLARRLWIGLFVTGCLTETGFAQKTLTWPQAREEFEKSNPTLLAARLGIEESRDQEITAFLRPNPDFSFGTDGTQLTPYQGVWRPFAGTQFTTSGSYLHER